MSAGERPLILFIPGLLPKPKAQDHRDALLRCLVTGLRRIDAPVADALQAAPASFDISAWTFDFYGEHRDIDLDMAAIDAVIEQPGATAADLAEATSWSRRMTRWIYLLADQLPFSVAHLAGERIASHIRDVERYDHNENGIADEVRRKLKRSLIDAKHQGRPVLLIAHSMGSIIAYDALWELSYRETQATEVDLLLTMGSPLGQRFMQRRFKGRHIKGRDRYPTNIRHWINFAAVGDLTALDRELADDFEEMLQFGLVEDIVDEEVVNFFRLDGELNVHTEYGYLVNEKIACTVAAWWRGFDLSLADP
jgi:hypothetical protein